jgi:hypothetical protein
MSDEFGTIVNVATVNVGEFLTADVAIGAASLPVTDVSTFDEKGGQVVLNGNVYTYFGVDLDNSRLKLSTSSGLMLVLSRSLGGVTASALADDRVEIWPPRPEKKALVDFGVEEGEAVFAVVPHELTAVIQDGFRDEGNRETVLVEERGGGDLYVKDLAAQPAVIEATIAGDGVPPLASPTPVVSGMVGALHVKWAAIEGPDFVTYEVHISTSSGFVPSTLTLVSTTSATSITIKSLPTDVLLATDTEYYVKLVAYDLDGAAAPSDEGHAQLVKITNADVSAAFVYAGTVTAPQIVGGTINADLTLSGVVRTADAGARVELDAGGVTIYDSTGTPTTDLSTNGTSVFKGDAEIGGLTVTGSMGILGTNNNIAQNSQLQLAAGNTGNPTTSPTVIQDWETITFTKPGDATFNGSGLTSVQKVGTHWVCGYKKSGTSEYYVYRFDAAGVYVDDATPMIISSTVSQTTQIAVGGRCYSVASNGTLFKHRLLSDVIMFADPFTTDVNSSRWPTRTGSWSWVSGQAYLESTDSIDTSTIETAHDKNIKGAYVQAEFIEDNTANDGHYAMLNVKHSNGNPMAQIFVKGESGGRTLYCRQWDPYTNSSSGTFSMTYSKTTHRWFKIEEGGDGRFYFYTSADGSTWTARYDNPHTVSDADLATVSFEIYISDEGNDNLISYEIDNVEHGVINSSASFTYARVNTSQTPTIGNDGTNLLVAEYDPSITKYVVKTVDPATMAVTATDTMVSVSNGAGPLAGVMKGSFDIGSARWIFKEVGSLEWKVYTQVAGHASQNAEYFAADGGGSKGAVWDGSNFWALGTNGKLYKHTAVGAGSGPSGASTITGFKIGYTWYDSNATGGTHESMISPLATFTLNKRARLTVTSPSLPPGGGTDDPNSIRVYAGSVAAPGTVTLQGNTAAGIVSAIFNSLTTGAAPPGSNNFLTSGAPGQIRNAGGTLIISGDGTITSVPTELGTVDLNTITVNGKYSQTSDVEAAGGTNYPLPYAGFLEVDNAGGTIIQQTYTGYRNADQTVYPSIWRRFFISAAWTSWAPLFDDHGTDSTVGNIIVAASGWTIASVNARIQGKVLALRIGTITKTGSLLAVGADGNVANTAIGTLTAKYRPGVGFDQGGLLTGATGRGASFVVSTVGVVSVTWIDSGSDPAGGIDLAVNDVLSCLGTVIMA